MIKTALALITHDFYKEEKYILSLREDSISLPTWEIDNYKNLQLNIKKYLIDNVFTDKQMANGYINPKFIGVNEENICRLFPDSDNYLYFLYGCVCPKLTLQPNFFWKSFNILDTNIITELGIINEVISKTI